MYLYIETWNAKPAWKALDLAGRQEFVGKVQELLGQLVSDDLQLLGCVLTDDDTQQHGGYQYGAVWQAADRSHIKKIEDGTERIGWHDYFEQVNHGSEHVGPEVVIKHMMES